MKIAVTTRFLTARHEGVGHHNFELLSRLINNHPNIEWHLVHDGKTNLSLFTNKNSFQHKLSPRTRHPLLWYYWYEKALPKLLEKVQPDAIWYPDGFISLKANIPSLLTIHDLAYLHFPEGTISSHRRYLKWLMPRQLEKANHIACVSDFTLQDVQQSFGIPSQKLSIVSNAANPKFKPLSLEHQEKFREQHSSGAPYFLYLGSLHPRKNIYRLIEAYTLFRQDKPEGPKLILAGRWAWKSDSIRKSLVDSPFREDIIHLVDIDSIIHSLVGSAMAMVYVSIWEGFGMPVLEAMQAGVPVITSQDSAMTEVAQETAIYVDPYDVRSIASGLDTIYSDPSLPEDLGNKGRSRAESYNWDTSAKLLSKELLLLKSMK